jgi:uncharacterized membrane-anchored protein YitT (DUF2179 family)
MVKEDKKEAFYIITVLSSNLAASLNFVTIVNTSVGIEIVSLNRTLGSTIPNWWWLFHLDPNIALFIVTMMLWQ